MVRNTKRNRKNYNKRKIMSGGFTGDEETSLLKLGFSQDDIDFLQNLGLVMTQIEPSLNTINQTTDQNWTPQELIAYLRNINDGNSINSNHSSLGDSLLSNISNSNESLNLSNISGVSEHDIDDDNNSLNLSDEDSSLHLSDLEGNPSALTDYSSNNSENSNDPNDPIYNNPNYSSVLTDPNDYSNDDSNNTTTEGRGGKSRKKRAKTSKKNKRKISKKRSKRVTRKSRFGGQKRTRKTRRNNMRRGNQIRLPQDNTLLDNNLVDNTLVDNTLVDNTLVDNTSELNTSKTPGKNYGGFN